MGQSEKIKLNLNSLGEVIRKDGQVFIKVSKDVSVFEGKKGNYVDAIRWDNGEADQYGQTASLQISTSKEQREAGIKGAYLGNFSPLKSDSTSAPATGHEAAVAAGQSENLDLPF